ncbi:pilus assembly protein [Massilia sp. RP-1-19]|uniref:Pilus assembly protein n=1 Tax=Massilia polaris TaxID=2728846 RepID=A0A848HK33_9BURK|nr:TadE family protein [Massilia polaris]NML60301.1 pilus assembly protein [Massilia polaris]
MPRPRPRPRPRFVMHGAQRGFAAVEFAMFVLVFFTYIVAIMELSRALFLWNTMTEVTRRAARAAAVSAFDAASINAIRSHAMFDSTRLPLAGDVTDAHLAIDYLRSDAETPVAAMPGSAAENLVNCTANPNGTSCVRFVRVRLCVGGAESCSLIPYTTMTGLDSFVPGSITFPRFTTISPIGSLGRMPSVAISSP